MLLRPKIYRAVEKLIEIKIYRAVEKLIEIKIYRAVEKLIEIKIYRAVEKLIEIKIYRAVEKLIEIKIYRAVEKLIEMMWCKPKRSWKILVLFRERLKTSYFFEGMSDWLVKLKTKSLVTGCLWREFEKKLGS